MELKFLLAILWKRAWLLILAPLLVCVISFMVSERMEPVYRASVTLLVSPEGSSSLDYSSLLTSERVAKTYSELLTKRPLLQEVIQNLDLNLTSRQLQGKVDVVQPTDTQLLKLYVEDSDPEMAVIIANNITSAFLRQHNQRRSDRSVYVEIVESADLPATKLRPRTMFNVFVSAIAALFLALGFTFILEHFNDTITNPENVEQEFNIDILATIPKMPRSTIINKKIAKQSELIAAYQPHSPLSEAYRMLRTNIQFVTTPKTNTFLFTSAIPNEGKTMTIANLGIVMAQAGKKTLLIDADLRQPMLHDLFEISNNFGLTNYLLSGNLPNIDEMMVTMIPNLFLMPSGLSLNEPYHPSSAELLVSDNMKNLISHFKDQVDIILIDSPPVLAVTDAVVLASYVNEVALIIACQQTAKSEIREALRLLKRVKANVLGTVLTKCKSRSSQYHYYPQKGIAFINLGNRLRDEIPSPVVTPTPEFSRHLQTTKNGNGNGVKKAPTKQE